MKILHILKRKEGAIHWYGQRISALAIAPLTLFFILQGASQLPSHSPLDLILNLVHSSPILSFISVILIVWHGSNGIESILDDYVHDERTKYLACVITKIVSLIIIKYTYILIYV